jgi:hypothetical protein
MLSSLLYEDCRGVSLGAFSTGETAVCIAIGIAVAALALVAGAC